MIISQDYRLSQPSDRKVRAACEEVRCDAHRFGWETFCDERTDLGLTQATYIRQGSGRTFTEHKSGPLTVFRFASGQRCFGEHFTRPQRLLVTRTLPGRRVLLRRHNRAADWIEDAQEHMGGLLEQEERG